MKKTLKVLLALVLAFVFVAPAFVFPASAASVTFVRKLGVHVDYQTLYTTPIRPGSTLTTANAGCGATAVSMIINYYTSDTEQNGDTCFRLCDANGHVHGGMDWYDIQWLCAYYNINIKLVSTANEWFNALMEGKPSVALVKPGHFIALTGAKIENGVKYVMKNDPATSAKTGVWYKLDDVWAERASEYGICSYDNPTYNKENDFYAEVGKYSRVEDPDGYLNIRATASSSGTIVGTVPSGTYVKVEAIENSGAASNAANTWAKISYNGINGYVAVGKLHDGGDKTSPVLTLSTPKLLDHNAVENVSWVAIEGATKYKYSVEYYEGEPAVSTAKSITSGETTSTSFSFTAPATGKYATVKVTSCSATDDLSTTIVNLMLGRESEYPTDKKYIPVATINGGTGSSSSTLWTSGKGSSFGMVYWVAIVASPNDDGTYTVTNVYANGASKSVTVSGNNILLAVHMDYPNFEYANEVVVGDKLTLVGIYLSTNTIHGYAHILVNGGQTLLPTKLSGKDSNTQVV